MPSLSRPVPMISALALGPLPQLIQREMGDKALRSAFRASGLTSYLIEEREGYIPQPSLTRFFAEFARLAGQRWVLGPAVYSIQLSDYGTWGTWVLSAPTLKQALARGCATIRLHGTNDSLVLTTENGLASVCYTFAAARSPGYEELAIGGAAALISYCREYLGPTWLPNLVGLDLAGLSRRDLSELESWFGCRVAAPTRTICIQFPERVLDTPKRRGIVSALTLEDVIRERRQGQPRSLPEQVRSLIRRNLSDGLTGIEGTARSLDMSVRRLQQHLNSSGVSYRELLKGMRVERAQELLKAGEMSVTEIAYELGYEHIGHFTRMFRTEVGMSPSGYAKQGTNS